MVENEWNGREFTSFEYKEIQISEDKASFYLDCYENFGWTVDDKFPPQRTGEKIQIKMKSFLMQLTLHATRTLSLTIQLHLS